MDGDQRTAESDRHGRRARYRDRRRQTTIRSSLARNLTMMILLTSGSILVVSHHWSLRMVSELSESLIRQQIDLTAIELRRFFQPIETTLALFRDWSRVGLVEFADLEAIRASAAEVPPPPAASIIRLNERFIPVLERLPQITSMMLSDTRGNEFMLIRSRDEWSNRTTSAESWNGHSFWMRREGDGSYRDAFWRELEYDPRDRPWFEGAIGTPEDDGVHWTTPYKFFTTRDPGITASVRWTDPDDPLLAHVIAFDVKLLELSRFTTSLRVSPRGKAFIVNEDGIVTGLPRDARFDTPEKQREKLLSHIEDLDLPEVADAVAAWQAGSSEPGDIISYKSGGETWWAGVRLFRLGNHDYRIAVIAPEEDCLSDVMAQRNLVLAIIASALLLAFLLAMVLARRYSAPLAALAQQAERIKRLEVSEATEIESNLVEVNQLADSHEHMRTALDSFSRYVPLEVVRELMRRDEAATIGGSRRIITVLFTDIQGFTTIAEGLDPEALAQHMSEYFQAMLGTIQGDGFGEVTQLTGDGFVAFWGAPIENADHATHAVRTVLACRERLAAMNADWRASGRPELPTRFGLATGPVVVGNVGSPERLVYTAVGDTLNLASRLEGINRFYGTWVLAAEATRRATGDAFAWRRVDRVRAKGKHEAIELFELLGHAGAVPAAILEFAARYEAALDHYRARDFDASAALLETLARDHPGDRSVARLLDLVQEFGDGALPDDWDGTTNFQQK